MRRFAALMLGILVVVCAMIGTARPAWGYVDPGSGLLALQGVASVVGTMAFYFRKRLRAIFPAKPKDAVPAYPAKPKQEPQKVA